MGFPLRAERQDIFKRRHVTLEVKKPSRPLPTPVSKIKIPEGPEIRQCTVLVVNSGTEMAKEMTMQITLAMPGCSIMYAPTIEIAKWILGRRKIDLVVSSAILPDGGVQRLRPSLERLESPPDIVVVGSLSVRNAEMIDSRVYEFATWRPIGKKQEDPRQQVMRPIVQQAPKVGAQIQSLGADLRNDLNNPLQEIVAMVFVARATGDTSPQTVQALDAIDRAAKNMASVVKGIEGKIRGAVDVVASE